MVLLRVGLAYLEHKQPHLIMVGVAHEEQAVLGLAEDGIGYLADLQLVLQVFFMSFADEEDLRQLSGRYNGKILTLIDLKHREGPGQLLLELVKRSDLLLVEVKVEDHCPVCEQARLLANDARFEVKSH